MRPALLAAARRVGYACGPHTVAGVVYALGTDERRSSDTPPWLQITRWLVLAPLACALIASAVSARLLAGLLPARRPRSNASPLTYGLAGFLLGDFTSQRRHKLVQVWRLDTQQGARVLRVAIPPAHRSDVRVGDTVLCWVRPLRDGTFATDRAENLRTGERISPSRQSPVLLVLACGYALLFTVLAASVLLTHA